MNKKPESKQEIIVKSGEKNKKKICSQAHND